MIRSRSRRLGAALVAAGVLCGAGAFAAVVAPSAGAVELFSFDLRANAEGFQYYNAAAKDAALDNPGAGVPMTQASLQSGPVGYGLSTVAWPGALAANGGTLLLVVNPDVPPAAANSANYPLRAEARTGQNPPDSHNGTVAGTDLTARATNDTVSADAVINKAAGIPGIFGTTTVHSLTKNTAEGGVAEATSLVQDINLGEGVIKIESVRSIAKASTDGSTSDGEARTIVQGMTVGGQPAYVDENGFHIGEQGQPANAIANQIAQQALGEAGFKIAVSTPQKETNGAATTVTAGSLVITQGEGDQGAGTIAFGGATVSVTGQGGDPSSLLGETTDLTGGGDFGSGTGSLDDFGPSTGGNLPSGGTGDSGGNGPQAVGQLQPISSKGKPIRPAAVIFGLLGAGFLALGMKRLSDDVLAEQVQQTTCTLEGET
jgi:hypothetical protein